MSVGQRVAGRVPAAATLLQRMTMRNKLVEELRETNEALQQLMQQKQSELEMALRETDRILEIKLQRKRHDHIKHGLSSRRRARNELDRRAAERSVLPESTASTVENKARLVGCPGTWASSRGYNGLRTIYQSQAQMDGSTATDRKRVWRHEHGVPVFRAPRKQSEFTSYVDKALRLGVDVKASGHG